MVMAWILVLHIGGQMFVLHEPTFKSLARCEQFAAVKVPKDIKFSCMQK